MAGEPPPPYDFNEAGPDESNDQSEPLIFQDRPLTGSPPIDDIGSDEAPPPPPKPPRGPRRQSSFAQRRADGTPRTANRVTFREDEDLIESQTNGHGATQQPGWMSYEDPLESADDGDAINGQRLPLLTGIEAPSVTLASDDFDPEEHLEGARPTSGLRSAFMNMANSILGAGIIGQPYAFRQAGMLTGIILLIVLTITVDWTIRLIVINSKLSGANTFQATMQHCFGKSGLIAISVAQWAFAFGGLIAYCIIIGDTIPHVISALFPSLKETSFLWLLTDRRAIIVIFVLGISYPLSLYRDIAKLAKASTLALISMLIILITIAIQGPRAPPSSKGSISDLLFINTGVFQAIGVISFAFVCHHNTLLIYGSLKRPTLDRFATVTHYSVFVSFIACMTMALAGFWSFGSQTQGNVLNNFGPDNTLVNIARLCFGLNMLTTLPLETFVCREVMNFYYFPGEPHNPQRHIIFTTSLVVTGVGMALLTCDLGAVFEIIGATSACALAYILPPLCYIKLRSRNFQGGDGKKVGWFDRTWWIQLGPAVGVVTFGSVVMVISLTMSLNKMIRHPEAHRCTT